MQDLFSYGWTGKGGRDIGNNQEEGGGKAGEGKKKITYKMRKNQSKGKYIGIRKSEFVSKT